VASASACDARGGAASCTAPGRVAGFVDRARGYGAEILAGGSTIGAKGFFYQPSLIGGVAQDSEIVQKEVFGPVLTIQHFADDEEGIRWANDVPFGLASSVWTKDIKRGLNAARRLRFGTVWINDHLTIASEMPARRLQAVRLRQGHKQLQHRGLHSHQARDGQDRGLDRWS